MINLNLCLVIGIFLLSRVVYFFYFGIRFDVTPLGYYWQYIDVYLLKNNLLQSLYYLHSQPPLFNLFLGVVLKLFPHSYAVAFAFIYLAFGLLFAISLYLVMTEIGVRPLVGVVLTSLFMASPIVVEYENWLFYEYPTAGILTLSLLFLHRFVLRKEIGDGFKFFLLIALVVYIRGLLSLHWFLLVTILLVVFNKRDWKKILLCCFFPFILIFALYFKNFLVFNSFSISDAHIGSNLAITVTRSLSEEDEDKLINQKKITGLYKLGQFLPDLSKYDPYGIRIKETGIPLLDQKMKSTKRINTHNLIYLDVGQIDLKDAYYVLVHYPGVVLSKCVATLMRGYFLTSDHADPFYSGVRSKQWIQWDNFFKEFFLGQFTDRTFLFLLVGFPALLLYAFFLILQSFFSKKINYPRRAVIVFMLFTIILLILITLFVGQDHCRYRFLMDSFYLILFGLLISNIFLPRTR